MLNRDYLFALRGLETTAKGNKRIARKIALKMITRAPNTVLPQDKEVQKQVEELSQPHPFSGKVLDDSRDQINQ